MKFSKCVIMILVCLLLLGCGKKSGLEGKIVDGKGQPIAGLKIVATQVTPIKGYEYFETVTDSDGNFFFKKLFPSSKYMLKPWPENWTTKMKIPVESGPEGEVVMLPSPLMIRDMVVKEGIMRDSKTDLNWQISPTDGLMRWAEATRYCENLTLGGHEDWRLPTISELRSLIRGCPNTETGGSCGVTDSCSSFHGCHYSCDPCPEDKGPGQDGAYWPPDLSGDVSWHWSSPYWSSSSVLDFHQWAWRVVFEDGSVDSYYYGRADYTDFVRCVR